MTEQADALKRVEFFASLSEDELGKIVSVAKPHRIAAGKAIFREGDDGDRLYIILLGQVRISKFVPRAGEEALAILNPGDFFGEMALIDDAPRSAYAIANSDTHLLGIDRVEFEALMEADKPLGITVLRAFCRTLSYRLRQMNSKLQALYAISG